MKTAAGRRESTILPVQIDALRVPRAGVAQRRFSQAHGHAFAAAFDFGKLGYPVVNRVDGTNWLIDGQHRMYALRKQAGTKVWHLVVLSRFAGVSGRCLPSGPTPLVHVIEVIWRSSSRAWVAPAMAGVATAAVVVTRRCGFLGSPTTSGWSSKTL